MTAEEIEEAAEEASKTPETPDESWKDDAAQVLEEYAQEDDAPTAPATDDASDAPVDDTPTAEGTGTVQTAQELAAFYEGKDLTNAKEVRDTFLRKSNELAEQRKALEAEREQVAGQTRQEAQQWAANPVRTALSKMYEHLAQSLQPEQQEHLGSLLTQIEQVIHEDGLFDPRQRQAQAQHQQWQQQAEQYQRTEKIVKAKEGFWAFQQDIGKVLSEQERGELLRTIEIQYAQSGKLPDFKTAWQSLVQQKQAMAKPVARVSPAKRGQQLQRTAERGTASSHSSGADDYLDLAAQVLAEYQA